MSKPYTPRHKWFPRAPIKYSPRFAEYELAKADFIAKNPRATPEQYTEAMRVLASRCGI